MESVAISNEQIEIDKAEMDEIWSFVNDKSQQYWLWWAIYHNTGIPLAYCFGTREHKYLDEFCTLLSPFKINIVYSDNNFAHKKYITESKLIIGKKILKKLNVSIYHCAIGAVVYIKDKSLLIDISKTIYQEQFFEKTPTENIMTREYATLTIEYISSKGGLADGVNVENCRAPFTSLWDEKEIPSEDELKSHEKITGLTMSLYLMGDFAKYSMAEIDHWSTTPISQNEYITGETLIELFLSRLLNKSLELYRTYEMKEAEKKEYLKTVIENESLKEKLFIVGNVIIDSKELWDYFDKDITEDEDNDEDKKEYSIYLEKSKALDKAIEKAEYKFIESLNKNEAKRYSSIVKQDSRPVEFDKDIVIRYIHKKIIDLGWTKEFFENFDSNYVYDRLGYSSKPIERIGKKYQWIALFEAFAKISDNFKWIEKRYDDWDDNKFFSTSQISQRDIDPTVWIDKTPNQRDYSKELSTSWWEMDSFTFSKSLNITDEEWSSDENILPNFAEYLMRTDREENIWYVLRGFSDYNQNLEIGEEKTGRKENFWYRINSVIVRKDNRQEVIDSLEKMRLESPDVFSPATFISEIFYGEFYWTQYFNRLDKTMKKNFWKYEERFDNLEIELHIPTNEYFWEYNVDDSSFIESPNCYLPSQHLIEELELLNVPERYGTWENKNGKIIFQDPSIFEKGSSYALIDKEIFKCWLEMNGYEVIWIVGGEKQVYHSEDSMSSFSVHRRYIFNYAFAEDDTNNIEQLYFKGSLEEYNR